MPNLIPPGDTSAMPAQPAQAGADPSQGNAADPTQGQTTDPSQQAPASLTGQAVDGADDGGARPVGTVQQANDMATDDDPYARVEASPEEEAQYQQFISRYLLAISDQRKTGKHGSMHDTVMAMLNNAKQPAAIAVGQATASVAWLIVQQAQHAGVKYDPEVLFHANYEATASMYLMGLAAGIFKGMGPMQEFDEDGGYPFNQKDLRVIAEAQIQAVRFFGNYMMRGGMLSESDQKANQDFWDKQVKREVKTGQVPEHVIQMMHQSGFSQGVHEQAQDQLSAGQAAQNPDMGQMQAQQQPPPGGGQQPPPGPQPGPQAPPPGGGQGAPQPSLTGGQ